MSLLHNKYIASTLLLLSSLIDYTLSQQTSGADPAQFTLYENCADCSGNVLFSGQVPYGDNGCYNIGQYSVRIECSSAYSGQYTANFYSITGCGAVMSTITGYGNGCVAAGTGTYSAKVNCEYSSVSIPPVPASDIYDYNPSITSSLVAPTLSTGKPYVGGNTAGQGSPVGYEGTAPINSSDCGNQVSYGQDGILGGAIIGGKGACSSAISSNSSSSGSSGGLAAYNGGINEQGFTSADQYAQGVILANPPPPIQTSNTGASSSQNSKSAKTSTAYNSNQISITISTVALTLAGVLIHI